MQAAIIHQWGNASQLEVTEVPQPIVGHGEVLVKISFAALNPIDYKMRNGRFKWFMNHKFPKILGLEASGHIEALGNGVDGLHVGDPVFIHPSKKFRLGCYAQYNTVLASQVFRLPAHFDLLQGSALTVAPVTALQVLRDHGKISKGSTILINGASGSVGLCAVQIAKMMGATVVGVCSGRNIDLVQSYGADRVIDYTKTDITQLKEQFDLVFDCVSTLQFKRCKNILTPNGQYINLMLRPLDLLWQHIRNPFFNQKFHTVLMAYRPDDIAWVVQKIEQKAFQIPIDTIYPLKDVQAAHEYLESGRAKGKIILDLPR